LGELTIATSGFLAAKDGWKPTGSSHRLHDVLGGGVLFHRAEDK
jgi:hypothetical protein